MFSTPLLRKCLRPKFNSLKFIRGVRPTLKISKDRFQLTIDVRQFDKDEIRVKARPEFVVIEGKQERQTNRGYLLRRFVRKFKLPEGCDPENMKTTLSEDGILTITAKRKTCGINLPCEKLLTIKYSGPSKGDDSSLLEPKVKTNPCAKFVVDKKGDKKP